MKARREFRNRRDTEVELLDALVDRHEEGMTVFELRAAVEADIDAIEEALATLKDDGLISVEDNGERVVIKPAPEVVPDPTEAPDEETGLFEALKDRFGF